MTTLASFAYVQTLSGPFRYCVSIWNDEQLIEHRLLPESLSQFNQNSHLVISPDGRFVAAVVYDGSTYLNTWVYTVEDEEIIETDEVPELGQDMETFRFMSWSPRGYFISPLAQYAYDPYEKTLINLPGPTPGLPFSVLPKTGLIFEGVSPNPTPEPEECIITARDLFNGEVVPAPDGVNSEIIYNNNGFSFSAMQWRDDSGIIGLLENDSWDSRQFTSYQRFVSTLGWVKNRTDAGGARHLYPIALLEIGAVYYEDVNPFASPEKPLWLLRDTGEITRYAALPQLFLSLNSFARYSVINFTWNGNHFFRAGVIGQSWSPVEPQSGTTPPVMQGMNLFGSNVLGTPPSWTFSRAPWGGFPTVSLISARSPERWRNPISTDGVFWTNRRFAEETLL